LLRNIILVLAAVVLPLNARPAVQLPDEQDLYKKTAGAACGVRRSRYGKGGLYSPGSRRDSRNPGGNEATDHHERHGRVDTVLVYHNVGIISRGMEIAYNLFYKSPGDNHL
jgi:hypothetical protein